MGVQTRSEPPVFLVPFSNDLNRMNGMTVVRLQVGIHKTNLMRKCSNRPKIFRSEFPNLVYDVITTAIYSYCNQGAFEAHMAKRSNPGPKVGISLTERT